MAQETSPALSPRMKNPGQSSLNCIAPVGVRPEPPGTGICVRPDFSDIALLQRTHSVTGSMIYQYCSSTQVRQPACFRWQNSTDDGEHSSHQPTIKSNAFACPSSTFNGSICNQSRRIPAYTSRKSVVYRGALSMRLPKSGDLP
jgi:hypothetical protein